jgi:hypothetical protein
MDENFWDRQQVCLFESSLLRTLVSKNTGQNCLIQWKAAAIVGGSPIEFHG